MNPPPVGDALTRRLVAGSHAEGVTNLAVAVVIETDERVLLIETPGHDFTDTAWDLPAGLVLPGETLLDAIDRIAETTTGLQIHQVTGYLGHDDHLTDDTAPSGCSCSATAVNPHHICHSATVGHQWANNDEPDTDTHRVMQRLFNLG